MSPGRTGAPHAGVAIADRRRRRRSAARSPRPSISAHASGVSRDARAPSASDPSRRRRRASIGKRSCFVVAERIAPRRRLVDVVADVVDEREQRRHRAEAARDRPPHVAAGPQRLEVPAGLAQHRDVGVAEAVDRLLAVADDEDRGLQRARCAPGRRPRPRTARAATPAPTAPGWCPGTRRRARGGSATRAGSGSARTPPSAAAARARAAARRRSRAPRARRASAGTRVSAMREHPPDAARHEHVQVAPVARRTRRDIAGAWPTTRSRCGCQSDWRDELRLRHGRSRLRGSPSCVRKCSRDAREGRLDGGRVDAALAGHGASSARSVRAQQQERAARGGPGLEEPLEAAGHRRRRRRAAPAAPRARRPAHVEIARARWPGSAPAPRGATMRRLSSAASPARARRSPSCANTSATCSSSRATARQMRSARSSDSSISRGTSVSSAIEKPGIEVGLERKLAQQRQAEGVDRADGDVGRAIAQLAPARRRRSRRAPPRARSVATMRSRISAAALRVKVIARMFDGIDAGAQQVDVAVDEHARLAGAGRRFERDVEAGIDGALAPGAVARVDARLDATRARRRRAAGNYSSPT